MSPYVYGFHEIDKANTTIAGGKGANLGELSAIEGIRVPEGFCISTQAFKRIIEETPSINELLDQLSLLKAEDRQKITILSRDIRKIVEGIIIPSDIRQEIYTYLSILGENNAYAVRSSATAEDLPNASFAGQQDTYLNVIGKGSILQHISKCWASLFTDRAVIYRIQNGFDHRQVYLSVIIQRMILPQASGIAFTADPVSANRKILSVDAGFGLGEALVSGLVNPDVYKVRSGSIIGKKIAAKKTGIYARQDGGTQEQKLEPEQQSQQALTDKQILQLEQIARKIEAHFGQPQDIEWCLADDTFYIVQSRPITTLFPVPETNDNENHVYVSVGHQQMMTDPIKPLGLSVWNLTAARPMFTAGGRLFVDVSTSLASPATRQNIMEVLGQSDPRIKDALITIMDRGDFIKPVPGPAQDQSPIKSYKGMTAADILAQAGNDPSIVTDLISAREKSIAELKEKIRDKSGSELFDLIREDIQQSRTRLFEPKNLGVIMAGVNAAMWINDKMNEWLGEKSVADTLTQSVSNNVTSEMGLALLDVADVIRPYPEVTGYLSNLHHGRIKEDNFLDELARFHGGQLARKAIDDFLSKYGMRCAGEIDITKTRWSENPAILVPLILSNIKNFEPNAGNRKFEQGLQEAMKKQQELLSRLQQLPEGEQKVRETKQMIGLIRDLAGYREFPKYAQVRRYFIYKQAFLKEIGKLVQTGILREKEDAYYLSFEELHELVRSHKPDYLIIEQRKEDYKLFEKLFPPRVLTSEGEIITGAYKRENIPEGSLIGLPVSAGVVEGRARVILHMEDADLGEEDILVTTFTDPSWTPLFVSIKGLVTEVGGQMTHGAVIAREYGLPAVVGVENAASLLKDGQRIRVNGTEGYIEILD